MTVPYWSDAAVTLHLGDCLDVLAAMEPASVDAVVTDPPYGLEFMGKDWDTFGRRQNHPLDPSMQITRDGSTTPRTKDNPWQKEASGYGAPRKNPRCRACGRLGFSSRPCECPKPDWDTRTREYAQVFQAWCQQWAAECLRVLKPGGHLLAFGGTRTWHRLACGVEDAGFEIRDAVADLTGREGPGLLWLYGSGFPKSLDVSKAIDKAAGAEREVVGPRVRVDGKAPGRDGGMRLGRDEDGLLPVTVTAPATEDAARWEGWGTALKPAWEPIVVARKPLAGTVAGNVTEHGTGALNVDGCRVGHASEADRAESEGKNQHTGYANASDRMGANGIYGTAGAQRPDYDGAAGRWPPNVVLGPDAAAELDRQSGVLTSGAPGTRRIDHAKNSLDLGVKATGEPETGYADSGGASRFFPVFRYEAKAPASERPRGEDGTAHPTVKPVDLMAWLVRLVTPPGGLVADPFAGSGTTAEACIVEGFRCVLIEKDPAYAALIRARLRKDIQPAMFGS